ncbi:hypothetical protein B0H21DRAFT_585390 [Amylocystis lapponica]|nr:hypothetical protein B0H21DRAFT_585390 [Amylocystis lapponica]
MREDPRHAPVDQEGGTMSTEHTTPSIVITPASPRTPPPVIRTPQSSTHLSARTAANISRRRELPLPSAPPPRRMLAPVPLEDELLDIPVPFAPRRTEEAALPTSHPQTPVMPRMTRQADAKHALGTPAVPQLHPHTLTRREGQPPMPASEDTVMVFQDERTEMSEDVVMDLTTASPPRRADTLRPQHPARLSPASGYVSLDRKKHRAAVRLAHFPYTPVVKPCSSLQQRLQSVALTNERTDRALVRLARLRRAAARKDALRGVPLTSVRRVRRVLARAARQNNSRAPARVLAVHSAPNRAASKQENTNAMEVDEGGNVSRTVPDLSRAKDNDKVDSRSLGIMLFAPVTLAQADVAIMALDEAGGARPVAVDSRAGGARAPLDDFDCEMAAPGYEDANTALRVASPSPTRAISHGQDEDDAMGDEPVPTLNEAPVVDTQIPVQAEPSKGGLITPLDKPSLANGSDGAPDRADDTGTLPERVSSGKAMPVSANLPMASPHVDPWEMGRSASLDGQAVSQDARCGLSTPVIQTISSSTSLPLGDRKPEQAKMRGSRGITEEEAVPARNVLVPPPDIDTTNEPMSSLIPPSSCPAFFPEHELAERSPEKEASSSKPMSHPPEAVETKILLVGKGCLPLHRPPETVSRPALPPSAPTATSALAAARPRTFHEALGRLRHLDVLPPNPLARAVIVLAGPTMREDEPITAAADNRGGRRTCGHGQFGNPLAVAHAPCRAAVGVKVGRMPALTAALPKPPTHTAVARGPAQDESDDESDAGSSSEEIEVVVEPLRSPTTRRDCLSADPLPVSRMAGMVGYVLGRTIGRVVRWWASYASGTADTEVG